MREREKNKQTPNKKTKKDGLSLEDFAADIDAAGILVIIALL